MRKTVLAVLTVIFASSSAYAQNPTPGYYLIYGNRDGAPVDVNIDSGIEIKVWAVTPAIGSGYEDLNGDGVVDSIAYMFTPLASNDSFIVSRDGGEVFFPLTWWLHMAFCPPEPDSTPGYTNQYFWGICCDWPGYDPFSTNGDTIHIATFYMHTALDSSLINEILCPFIEGYSSLFGSGLVWALQDNHETLIYPFQTFPCLNFVDYFPGDANSSGSVNGLDVIYLVRYLKGNSSPPDPIFAGDANGDCLANGLDVTYLANYFKGTGPPPFLGSCH